ncbi:MAG: amidohydrolase family protein [Saprospiraceae bacterium]|nr:amidohydrolase family protein [Saprospiraceae bacterium]MBP7699857.1 amidohydrolase family protein [Saprospiraceae bacterium]
MYRKITADFVYPIHEEPVKEGVIILDETNKIVAIETRNKHNINELEVYKGILIPGFVNAHCHLELSHLHGQVPTGTTLLPFLKSVVSMREVPQQQIEKAIKKWDRQMQKVGIVAVGDISNKADTFIVKSNSPIRYATFIEMFDFLQNSRAEQAFEQYWKVFEKQIRNTKDSYQVTPHAPYSVSKKLFQLLKNNTPNNTTVSIHNQETFTENELFQFGKGAIVDFFESLGISLSAFKASNKTSIHYALENMNPQARTLFVHNTLTTPDDIAAAHAWSKNVFWATCPNANLYIENRLPNYKYFLDADAKVCIGTDSLTSNWTLSVLEELKSIKKYQSYVPTEVLLKWATLHGAEALGFEDTLGSVEIGKRPGINLLFGLDGHCEITHRTRVKKLV